MDECRPSVLPIESCNQTRAGIETKLRVAFTLCREEIPRNMTQLVVKYNLDADGLLVKDLIKNRDFLAQRLGLPMHLLAVLSVEFGSVVIRYWVLQDILPLAELALYREDAQEELTQHGVEDICYANHPLQQPNLVRCRGIPFICQCVCDVFHCTPSPSNAGGPTTTRCTL